MEMNVVTSQRSGGGWFENGFKPQKVVRDASMATVGVNGPFIFVDKLQHHVMSSSVYSIDHKGAHLPRDD